jgi:hypothetical protein
MVTCISLLIIVHTYQLLTAVSTIEFYQLQSVNPFFLSERSSDNHVLHLAKLAKERNVALKLSTVDYVRKFLEVSCDNWKMVFESNPLLWMVPHVFRKFDDMEGVEWKLKVFYQDDEA